ncbi:hypothetical protein M3J09_009815 [Ascochyta lentis]
MAASRKPDSDKSSEYAIAASKGFSYYLPKSAQQDLQKLLKQLPSPARSIYDEYYRDLMCSKACAAESAAAMATFVTESFPVVARRHNAFAGKMNAEIQSDMHEGYLPILFPIVREPRVRVKEVAAADSGSEKRKRGTVSTAKSLVRGETSNKKAKTKVDAQSTTSLEPEVDSLPSPTHVPNADVPSSTHPQPDKTSASTGTAKHQNENDAQPPTPDSTHNTNAKQSTSPPPLAQQPQPNSPQTTTPPPPTFDTSHTISTAPTPPIQHARATEPNTPGPEQEHHDPTSHDTTSPIAHTPKASKPSTSALELESPTNSPTPTATFFSEEQSWDEGMRAIESFPWE